MSELGAFAVHRWSGAFVDPELERGYREHHVRSWVVPYFPAITGSVLLVILLWFPLDAVVVPDVAEHASRVRLWFAVPCFAAVFALSLHPIRERVWPVLMGSLAVIATAHVLTAGIDAAPPGGPISRAFPMLYIVIGPIMGGLHVRPSAVMGLLIMAMLAAVELVWAPDPLAGTLYLQAGYGTSLALGLVGTRLLHGGRRRAWWQSLVIEEQRGRLEERAAELADATARAESANEAKTVFLRSMSHELRTPLNSILGYAQILLGEELAPRHHERVDTMQRSGRHLLSLINDVLDMGKIEAGRLDLEEVRMSLPGLVRDCAAFVRPAAEGKGLALIVTLDSTLPAWIEADERRLKQIVLNLLGNAVKFTEQGEVEVALTAHGAGARLTVRDTGPGIERSARERIFQPFEQTGDAGQRAKGTGLGLAIARQIARQMGGDLSAESVLGEGSTFALTLPLRGVAPPEDATPVEPAVHEPEDDDSDVPPPREVLQELFDLFEEGALSALRRLAEELAEEDPKSASFLRAVAARARDFDEDGVESLLRSALESTSD